MPRESDVESTTLVQRVVLLGVADLSVRGETPAHTGEVRRACVDAIDEVRGDVLGRISEADVMRALNTLESEGFVAETDVQDTSPVGKGRPRYALGLSAEAVLETFAGDERVARIVRRIRTE